MTQSEITQRDAHILKKKAVASLKVAFNAFNSSVDDARKVTVILMLQHSFEMLIKGCLIRKKVSIFDNEVGKSKGLKVCLRLGIQHLSMNQDEVSTLVALDLIRDDEQHFHANIDEGILHHYAQGSISIFDNLIWRHYGERLADNLPERVLPLGTIPPEDIQTLIDKEFTQIRLMLSPHRRQSAEAKAKLRTLMALGARSNSENPEVLEADVVRSARAIKRGASIGQVLPNLTPGNESGSAIGLQRIVAKFTKSNPDAFPVRYAQDEDATAFREVDLHSTFYLTRTALAKRVGITTAKSCAVRWKIQLEDDIRCFRKWKHGEQWREGYSDLAANRMKEILPNLDMDATCREYRTVVQGK